VNIVFCQLAPHRISRAGGTAPSLTVSDRETVDGKHSALVTLGTVPWAQFGQKVAAGQVGKTYTLAVFVRSDGDPVTLRLEMERAGSPWDRVFRRKTRESKANHALGPPNSKICGGHSGDRRSW
jgi:hypothetical protein